MRNTCALSSSLADSVVWHCERNRPGAHPVLRGHPVLLEALLLLEPRLLAEHRLEHLVRVLPEPPREMPVSYQIICSGVLNLGHMAKVGVRHIGKDRENVSFACRAHRQVRPTCPRPTDPRGACHRAYPSLPPKAPPPERSRGSSHSSAPTRSILGSPAWSAPPHAPPHASLRAPLARSCREG